MEWSDDALVIGSRRHGESGLLLEILTRDHGRHLGFVPGGRSRRVAPMLQPGNAVRATWRSRLDEHLGTFAVEATELRAARYIANPRSLYGLAAMTALLRLLPERDPNPTLFDAAQELADHLDEPEAAGPLFVGFELTLLSELGFGLDLSECAATGARVDLVFVSPRTGRAVSRAAGEPWRDKLLPLPAFLVHDGGLNRVPGEQLAEAFALTGYFLERWIFEPQGLKAPQERTRFVASVTREERP